MRGFFYFFLAFISCTNVSKTLPGSTGKNSEVLFVLDDALWENSVDSLVTSTFGAAIKGINQIESLFRIFQVNHNEFNSILKKHKNIVIISGGVKKISQKNKWATEQFVAQLNFKNNYQVLSKELLELRALANQVDNNNNNIKAVVSVLMLKEGWDVKNVTTVVGLRPFVASSNILPEQALGRGLRRMYFGQDVTEELNVVGTPAFIEFVESIKSEGVILEKRSMGKDSDSSGPTIIEVDKEKNIDKLDIEIPILSPSIIREYKNLEELNVENFKFDSVKLKEFTPEEQKNILFREIIDDKVVKEVKMRDDLHINATSIITFFTKSIMTMEN